MTAPQSLTDREFHESDGVEDWRALFWGAYAHFRTGSFAAGVELVGAIGSLAGAANHHPDVDLRPGGVTVRLFTQDALSLTERDLELARQISGAARERGASADPGRVQVVQIAIDALVSADVMPFWRAVLGYEQLGDEDVIDPQHRNPNIWFQDMDKPREQRNRIHVDVSVPHDQAEARVAAALAAGGRVVRDRAPMHWTLADPEGNEVDVATWQGRD
jgi:4a-hydroxytetrahydrobiopterin dehydratase